MEVSGLILAGGASRRMGTDKAVLPVDGQRLVDRAVACLSTMCRDVVVSIGSREIPDLAVRQVPDSRPGTGPLAGLVSGLAAAAHHVVLVLAVDMPHADPVLFDALRARWTGQSALVPTAFGQPQPLHAVWRRDVVPTLADLLATGERSVMDALPVIDATILDDPTTAGMADHDRWADNLNHPADLDVRP